MVFSMNLPPMPTRPLTIEPAPIDPDHEREIVRRATLGMNPEGAATLYPLDTAALLGGLAYLRQEHAQALMALRRAPVAQDASLAETAASVVTVTEDLVAGLWEREEMQQMRNRVADAEQALWKERESMRAQVAAVKVEQAASLREQQAQMKAMRERVDELEAERRKEQARLTGLRKMLDK